jgi:hypothetical protein
VLLVAVLVTLSGPVTVAGVGLIVVDRVDGTVRVDNPARPSETFCESASGEMAADAGCGAPARIERDVDAELWDALERFVGLSVIAFPLWVLVVGTALHAGSWLFGPGGGSASEQGDDGVAGDGPSSDRAADGGVAASVAVALWGTVPSLVGVAVLLAAMWLTFDPLTVTPETAPSALVEHTTAALRPVERLAPVVGVLSAVWSGAIWRFGLEHARGLSAGAATGVAGATALLSLLVTLA